MVECGSLFLLSIRVVVFYGTLHSSAGSETHFLTDPCSEGKLVLMIQLKKTNSLECHSIITVTVCEMPSFTKLCPRHITCYLSFLWRVSQVLGIISITNEEAQVLRSFATSRDRKWWSKDVNSGLSVSQVHLPL